MRIEAKPIEPFGREVSGVDFTRPFTAEEKAAIRAAWVEGGIAIFRDCPSEDAHLALSRCFGEPEPSATKKLNLDRNPYIMALDQDEKTPVNIYEVDGERRTGWLGWHWDQAFMPEIVRGAALRMLVPARVAGETGFIHAGDAYDRLPQSTKERIEGLEVVYHFNGAQEQNRFGFPKSLRLVERDAEQAASIEKYTREFPPVVHPLVITQPESGRRLLKLSPMHARSILGMAQAESDALLHMLAEHLVDRRYAYFHSWRENDVVVWDNWSVIHCANGVPPGVIRRAQRTTILGDYKLGRYLDPAKRLSDHAARLVD
ncbi:MAG: TauD/TfdA family dioxygenase [Hydrogenophilaceae bacterium]|jgi:taurine dioxygenase|nr:TauD/TfdA family dioxygenase [Hydrogenophilaceae bacterium]